MRQLLTLHHGCGLWTNCGEHAWTHMCVCCKREFACVSCSNQAGCTSLALMSSRCPLTLAVTRVKCIAQGSHALVPSAVSLWTRRAVHVQR